jgi:hypothetical protein
MLLSKSPDDLLRWPGQTKQDTDALLAVLQTATQSLESEKILNDTWTGPWASWASGKDTDARKLLKKRLGEISVGRFIGPDADKVTVRELADDYKNDYLVNGKKSLDKARRSVNHLLDFFGDCRAHLVGAPTQ